MDWSEWRAIRQEKPRVMSVPLCADGAAMAELEKLRLRPRSKQVLRDAEAKVAAATMQVQVQTLPGDEWRRLKDKHRPTDPEAIKRGDEWDGETFQPAAIAACLTAESPLQPRDVDDMWETVSVRERHDLFMACWALNETVPDLSFTLPGTAATDGSGPSSTTAPPEA